PLADVSRQVRTSVHDDISLPTLPLPHVVKDRDTAQGLHDSAEGAGHRSKFRESEDQAAVRQRMVLRTIVAIHPCRVVAGRKFLDAWRRRRVVLASVAGNRLLFA